MFAFSPATAAVLRDTGLIDEKGVVSASGTPCKYGFCVGAAEFEVLGVVFPSLYHARMLSITIAHATINQHH